MKLRGALFGCGMISEFHLRAWNRIPEVEIVALGNRTIERAEARRDQFAPQARVYGELETMLEREPLDFIDILTTPALHRRHCLMAKQAGLNIICQKPLCDTLDDARGLVHEMGSYSKLFAVHENHRYRPWFQAVRERLRSGFFGKPSLLRLEHLNATQPGEAYKKELETGVFLEYGSHLVDMMRSLLGEPTRVYARTHHLNSNVRGESLVHAVYEYPETTAVIQVAWKAAALTQSALLLTGDEGEAWYEGTMTRGDTARFRMSKGNAVVHDETRCPFDDYVESFYAFERECVDAMLGRGRVLQTGEEHLKTLTCTCAAYDAAAHRNAIDIPVWSSNSTAADSLSLRDVEELPIGPGVAAAHTGALPPIPVTWSQDP
jgi:predicted dehydrogenase